MQLNYAPFLIKQNEVENYLLKWIESLWFAPGRYISSHKISSQLVIRYAEKVVVQHVSTVYVPYWLISCETRCPYTAKACHTSTEVVNGEALTKREWKEVEGVHNGIYNAILLCAAVNSKRFGVFKRDNWKLERIYYQDPKMRVEIERLREREKLKKQEKKTLAAAKQDTFSLKTLTSLIDSVVEKVTETVETYKAPHNPNIPPPRPKKEELLAFKVLSSSI